MNTLVKLTASVTAALAIAIGLAIGLDAAEAHDGRVSIPCPDGYTDCTGIPVDQETAPVQATIPTEVPTTVPTATPEPVFSCLHTHSDRSGEHIHYQKPHLAPGPVGVHSTYNPEKCGHTRRPQPQ